ncbi:xanthine phosphoribosyltransferase [Clostridia bacterium]|nr:xanthine phosphoribosyltransferase [Clostridia bacterium]
MDLLKDRITTDGIALGSDIVKVDSFLNHQIDVAFMELLGMEFGKRFAEERIDKILTVESSGIAVACMTAKYFNYSPIVFAKKTHPNTMTEEYYGAEVKSFTKNLVSMIIISKKYILPSERILIIDDFIAHGEAAAGMADLVQKAGAELVGVGAVIEKRFQGGGDRLRAKGHRVESLAIIESITDGRIVFQNS